MTSQEVRALIDAKIKGQGTNVDAGSVLPAILNGILDLIDSGGGGGTSDAVQYIPQILTAPQQMQARKNQGLYYSEETPAGVITWDGNTEGKESIDLGGVLAYKVANSPKDIPQDAFIGYTSTEQLETTPFSRIIDYGQTPGAEGKMLMGATSVGGVVIVADQAKVTAEGTTLEADGIYFTSDVRSFSYNAYDGGIHQIPAKYIPSTQTVPAVKIEIPSTQTVNYGIGYVLLNQYSPTRDVVFSIEGKTISQVAVRNMLDTTSTGDVWDFGTGNTYNFDTSGYYLVKIEVQETPSSSAYYYATVFVETVNQ